MAYKTMLESIPKNYFISGALIFLISAAGSKGQIVFQLISFGISLLCLFFTEPAVRRQTIQCRKEMLTIIALLYGPVLLIIYIGYQDVRNEERFREYLIEHRCKYVGSIITGYSPGGCDNVGNCSDGHEIEEGEYFCRATGNRLSFKNFTDGKYGQ